MQDVNFTDCKSALTGGYRRHDIYDEANLKAIEIKDYSSGKVYLSADVEKEALMDIQLLKDKKLQSVEWQFLNNEPSGPLLKFLKENNITVFHKGVQL